MRKYILQAPQSPGYLLSSLSHRFYRHPDLFGSYQRGYLSVKENRSDTSTTPTSFNYTIARQKQKKPKAPL